MSSDEKDKGFDYSTCSFEVRLTKKKFLHSVLRYVYFSLDRIIICNQPYQKKPEKIIVFNQRFTIKWIYKTKKQADFQQPAIGFTLYNDHEAELITFYGEGLIMSCLLDFMERHIFQANFLEEFDILQKIGKGKYAKVYKVKRRDTGEFFAVKYLHKQKMKDIENSEEALDNELNILKQLNHPNCLKMVSFYQDSVGYYILTELLDETKPLSYDAIKCKNPQDSEQMVSNILRQLLNGLKYIHSKGIMHRDLKPQNIMFATTKQGALDQLKLIDFGLAQYFKSQKYIYVHVGTPGYVAPEILANESDSHRYDEKCDLFSIGIIFHTLLTGKPVFQGTKFSQVLLLNKKCEINFSGPQYEKVNKDALELLYLMLEKNPLKRISAEDALCHAYFQIKAAQGDTNFIWIDSSNSNAITKEEVLLPKKVALNSQQDFDPHTSIAAKQMLKASIYSQLIDFKSINEINEKDPVKLQNQVDYLYKFTRDLFCLLEDLEDSKVVLRCVNQAEEEEGGGDSTFILKLKNSTLYSQSDKLVMPISFEQKKTRESSFHRPIKLTEQLEEVKEEDDNNQVVEKEVPKEVKNIRKGLTIQTKKGNSEEWNNPDQQKKSERSIDGEKIINKIKYPPKNMILNEMPSPISPPVHLKLPHSKLQLRLNQINSIDKINQEQKKLLPKEVIQLIEFFPQNVLQCYLIPDKAEIAKGMKARVNKLGQFLLYGAESFKLQFHIKTQKKLEEIIKDKNIQSWYIDLVRSMLADDEKARPTIKDVSSQLLIKFPFSK